MRGVHCKQVLGIVGDLGSSPHARGPRSILQHIVMGIGIIPACAGSTQRSWKKLLLGKDHPRMRGVHSIALLAPVVNMGSSPHARGPQVWGGISMKELRIIPACAGSTPWTMHVIIINWDHPRMRGVHTSSSQLVDF